MRVLGAPKDAGAIPLTSEFVGMVSYAPTTFHKLLDDEVESDGSNIGDVAPSHRLSWECAMADAPSSRWWLRSLYRLAPL